MRDVYDERPSLLLPEISVSEVEFDAKRNWLDKQFRITFRTSDDWSDNKYGKLVRNQFAAWLLIGYKSLYQKDLPKLDSFFLTYWIRIWLQKTINYRNNLGQLLRIVKMFFIYPYGVCLAYDEYILELKLLMAWIRFSQS